MDHPHQRYAKPLHGQIKQVKGHRKSPIKGLQSITDFLENVKAYKDELVLLGVPMDEDYMKKILNDLSDEYKELVYIVQACDISIMFYELHEKLLHLKHLSTTSNPHLITFLLLPSLPTQTQVNTCPIPLAITRVGVCFFPPTIATSYFPMLGHIQHHHEVIIHIHAPTKVFYQICGVQGHTTKWQPSFHFILFNL